MKNRHRRILLIVAALLAFPLIATPDRRTGLAFSCAFFFLAIIVCLTCYGERTEGCSLNAVARCFLYVGCGREGIALRPIQVVHGDGFPIDAQSADLHAIADMGIIRMYESRSIVHQKTQHPELPGSTWIDIDDGRPVQKPIPIDISLRAGSRRSAKRAGQVGREAESVIDLAEEEGSGVVGYPGIGLSQPDGSVKRGLEEPSLAFTPEVHLPFPALRLR